MQLRDITDSVAVITGASMGIGEAAARALVAEGANVVLAARSRDRIEALAEELGDRASAVATDVADEDQVKALFNHVRERHGGMDLLFNNAGVGYFRSFAESERQEWRETIDANVYGVINCTFEAIPLLRGRDGAMICSVASVAGRRGMEKLAVYNASKFAVVGFHDSLRQELGPEGIRCSVLEPGAVYTNWGYNVPSDKMKERRDSMEAMRPEDIANLLVYAFAQPVNVNLQEVLIMPRKQTFP